MTGKVSDVFFVRRRSDGSVKIGLHGTMSVDQEKHQTVELKPMVTTVADCMSPLLTSMKLFGLYFKSETCDKAEKEWLRRRINLSVIHSAVMTVLMWINVIRMFSVFTNSLRSSSLVSLLDLSLYSLVWVLFTLRIGLDLCSRCSQHKRNLERVSSSSSFITIGICVSCKSIP